jgi:capsular exopolysaccharide synthesis family protein
MLSTDTRLVPTSSAGLDAPLRDINPSNGPPPSREREVREYISSLLKRKWLVLTVVMIVTSAVALYVLSLPPIYESSAVLQLDSKEYVYMEDSRGTVMRSYNNYDYQNTQIRLLSNPHLMRQVVLHLDLEHKPGFLRNRDDGSILANIRRIFSGKRGAPPAAAPSPTATVSVETDVNKLSQARISQLEPYVSAVASGLKVAPMKDTNLVAVSMTHTDPQIAMEVVDALTKIFVANSASYETRGAHEAAETLGRQISELQTKIKQAEDARLEYLKSHNLPLEKGEGRNLTTDRLGKLSSQLLDAENERKDIEATYEAAKKASDPATVPSARESEEIRELRTTIHQLEQKRASLLQVYTAEWPEVQKVESEIRELKQAIAKTSNESVGSLKSKLDAAVAREAKLREAYYKERGAANNQTQDEVALASLNQQIETNREVYTMLFQRQTEMQVNSLDKSLRLGIVTPPVVATSPIGPPRFSKIAMAFLFSLIGGIGLAVLINQFDNTLKSADDVATHTSLPTLAMIPSANGNGNGALKGRILGRFRPKENHVTALTLTSDLRSPTAEAYRHLRASLLFTSTGRPPRTMLVTSGSPLEGKTTTAINTAISFAQSGAKVLLIDCDLRRPRVHRHFDLENRSGLTNYLAGQQDIDSLIVSHEQYPNLRIIPAGPMPANPADFLGSTEMRVLLRVLAERFDHVVIDSPPASSFADASIIATLVDGVILVAHSERSSRGVVRRVKQRLETVGANVYGVVLNQVDVAGDDAYTDYYNSYEDD